MAGKKTKLGLEENVAAALSYVLGWITGIIFYLVEDNKFVRFHAMQSILTFGIISAISLVLFPLMMFTIILIPLVAILSPILWIITVVLWIVLIVKSLKHEKFKLPIVGEWAEKLA